LAAVLARRAYTKPVVANRSRRLAFFLLSLSQPHTWSATPFSSMNSTPANSKGELYGVTTCHPQRFDVYTSYLH